MIKVLFIILVLENFYEVPILVVSILMVLRILYHMMDDITEKNLDSSDDKEYIKIISLENSLLKYQIHRNVL